MAEVILMPRLSDTMTEGVIASWHKKIGDQVKKGDLLAEIETDKATMELESYQNGTLLHIGTPNGGKLQVNDLLAIIGEKGEDVAHLVAQHSGGAAPANQEAVAPQPTPTPAPATSAAPAATTAPAATAPVAAATTEVAATGGRIFASPLAKKMAADKEIELSQVKGSGDNGRIIRQGWKSAFGICSGYKCCSCCNYSSRCNSPCCCCNYGSSCYRRKNLCIPIG